MIIQDHDLYQKKILIVDDQPTNLKILFTFLQSEGFQVLIAKSGASALKKLQKVLPDLILLDIMMPELDGLETCKLLKSQAATQEIPVIFMTALSDKVDKVKGLNVGAVDYLTKPLIKEEVLARINIHLKLRSVTQQLQQQNQKLAQEIRERQRAEQQLQYRLTLETALAQVSREFATNEAADLNHLLGILGKAVGVNHAYITRFRDHSMIADMTHEWCDSSTSPQIKLYQNVDTSEFPWWVKKYQNHEKAIISNVDEMPADAGIEKNLLKSCHVRSVLAVPIPKSDGQIWGTIAFNTTNDTLKIWTDEDVQLLQVVSEMIYGYCTKQQAQERLRSSEALYAGIFNHSAEGIFLVNVQPNHQFVYEMFNPTNEKNIGISTAEIVGKTPEDLFSPEMAAQVTERYRTCVEAGSPLTYEETLTIGDQTRIWRTILVPIRDINGQIIKLQGSARDITEEKHAEAEKVRQTKYRQLLASLTLKIRESIHIDDILQTTVNELQTTLNVERVIFCRFLRDHRLKVVSEATVLGFPNLLGDTLEPEDLPVRTLEEYKNGQIQICSTLKSSTDSHCSLKIFQQHQIHSCVIVPILLTHESHTDLKKLPVQNPSAQDSTHLWGLLSLQQCSEPREWTPLEIDLLQQLANQLTIAIYQAQLLENKTQYLEELARSNTELEHFAYIASHDLQAPLGVIANYAELLERRYQDQLDARGKKFIQYLVEGAVQMQKMIEDLLEYSRVNRQQKPFEPTDCNLVVEEACTKLRVAIRKNQVSVTSDPLPVVMGDKNQLIQLIQNLISNAIKYRSDKPPIVHIRAQSQNNVWLFSVQDNGIGIDSKYYQRIFQIFQRLHTSEEYPGTGIGLAICQKIVERHGGQIWVEPNNHQGSTFYFTLSQN
jgi:PAS domain S-box-containing protein